MLENKAMFFFMRGRTRRTLWSSADTGTTGMFLNAACVCYYQARMMATPLHCPVLAKKDPCATTVFGGRVTNKTSDFIWHGNC
jgi:hypothetical protein